MSPQSQIRINIGCGMTPTVGWRNYDNSLSVKLANRPFLYAALAATGFISRPQREFIGFCKTHDIHWADAVRRIPHDDGEVDVVYSSHMLEHLDREQAIQFIVEARRVLRPGGTLRLAVPDLSYHVSNYQQTGDADRFMCETHTVVESPKGLRGLLSMTLVGHRNHKWMYDGKSLCALLERHGLHDVRIMPAGQTRIADSGALDLFERLPESVFVEANKSAD